MGEYDQRAMHSLRASLEQASSSISWLTDQFSQLNATLQETNYLLHRLAEEKDKDERVRQREKE